MNRIVVVAAVSVLGLVAGLWLLAPASKARAEEPKGGTKTADFMRVKLAHSQKLLSALLAEDFNEVAKNSQALSLLSLSSNWQVMHTEEYVHYSKEFRRLADQLTQSAKDKNLEGATLSYMVLTNNCIHCHQHIRQAGKGIDRPPVKLQISGGSEAE